MSVLIEHNTVKWDAFELAHTNRCEFAALDQPLDCTAREAEQVCSVFDLELKWRDLFTIHNLLRWDETQEWRLRSHDYTCLHECRAPHRACCRQTAPRAYCQPRRVDKSAHRSRCSRPAAACARLQ